MATLRTNYKDDILAAAMDGKRQYQMINNPNGTVSFIDVTEYTQRGDTFSSGDINNTNELVNENHTHIRSQATELSNHESRISTNEGNIATNTSNIETNRQNISINSQAISRNSGRIASLDAYKLTLTTLTQSGESLYPTNVIRENWGGNIKKSMAIYIDIGLRSCHALIFYESETDGTAILFGAGVSFRSTIVMTLVAGTWEEATIQTS